MSQVTGKSLEERNAATVMLDIVTGTLSSTAAWTVSAETDLDATRLNGQKVLHALLAGHTAVRARMTVREGTMTNNCAWAWTRLRERFGKQSGAASCTEVFQDTWPRDTPSEDVWLEGVRKVANLPEGSLNSQAIEQLMFSGLSRHGSPSVEHHLRFRAPLA